MLSRCRAPLSTQHYQTLHAFFLTSAADAVLAMQIEIKETHKVQVDLHPAAFAPAIKRVATVAMAREIWP